MITRALLYCFLPVASAAIGPIAIAQGVQTPTVAATRSNSTAKWTATPSPPSSAAVGTRSPEVEKGRVGETTVGPSWPDVLLVAFNGLLAIFTFLLWRATAGLWDATRGMLATATEQSRDTKASIDAARSSAEAAHRSADIAERTLQLTQRPIMSLQGFDCRLVAVKQGGATVGQLEVVAQWKNVGPSFALDCHLENSFALGPPPPTSHGTDSVDAEAVPNVGSIGPGGGIDGAPMHIPIGVLDAAYGRPDGIIVAVSCRYRGATSPTDPAARLVTIASFTLEMESDPVEWKMGSDPRVRFRSDASTSFAS